MIVEALGSQSTPCFSSFSSVAASTCSISTVRTPHLTEPREWLIATLKIHEIETISTDQNWLKLRVPLGELADRVTVIEAPDDMLTANGARRAALERVQYGCFDPHLARSLAEHLPELTSTQHADDRVGHAVHRRAALPETQQRNVTPARKVRTPPQGDADIEIWCCGVAELHFPQKGNSNQPPIQCGETHPSGAAGCMAARARSESGCVGAGVPAPRRGSHDARRGQPPPEGREEDDAAEAEAEDGALRSLACMLPGSLPGGGG